MTDCQVLRNKNYKEDLNDLKLVKIMVKFTKNRTIQNRLKTIRGLVLIFALMPVFLIKP